MIFKENIIPFLSKKNRETISPGSTNPSMDIDYDDARARRNKLAALTINSHPLKKAA